MATRRVVVEGEEVLRKHAKSAGPVTPHLKEILQDMVETMREENGVGLAAPQVGIMRRMFVAQPDPGDDATVYYMIDPVITHYSEEKEWGVEGCLSVPDMVGDVERSVAIKIEATGLDGERREFDFEGFENIILSGGGTGVFPINFAYETLTAQGKKVTVCEGFRNASQVILNRSEEHV